MIVTNWYDLFTFLLFGLVQGHSVHLNNNKCNAYNIDILCIISETFMRYRHIKCFPNIHSVLITKKTPVITIITSSFLCIQTVDSNAKKSGYINIHLQWAVTVAFLLVIRGTRVLSSCPFTRLDKNFLLFSLIDSNVETSNCYDHISY